MMHSNLVSKARSFVRSFVRRRLVIACLLLGFPNIISFDTNRAQLSWADKESSLSLALITHHHHRLYLPLSLHLHLSKVLLLASSPRSGIPSLHLVRSRGWNELLFIAVAVKLVRRRTHAFIGKHVQLAICQAKPSRVESSQSNFKIPRNLTVTHSMLEVFESFKYWFCRSSRKLKEESGEAETERQTDRPERRAQQLKATRCIYGINIWD